MKKIILVIYVTFCAVCAKAQLTPTPPVNLASPVITTGDNKNGDLLYLGSDNRLHPIHLGPIGYLLGVVSVNGVSMPGYINPVTITALKGATGAAGATGPIGATGPAGPTGKSGNTIIASIVLGVTPASTLGNDGDILIDTLHKTLWGPKFAGAWPVQGINIVGPGGPPGASGQNSILSLPGQAENTTPLFIGGKWIAAAANFSIDHSFYQNITATDTLTSTPIYQVGQYNISAGINVLSITPGSSVTIQVDYTDANGNATTVPATSFPPLTSVTGKQTNYPVVSIICGPNTRAKVTAIIKGAATISASDNVYQIN